MARITAIYFGKFPPPFGGVTVKNQLLFRHLAKKIDIHQAEFFLSKASILQRFRHLLGDLLQCRRPLVLGLSQGSLGVVSRFLYLFNRKLMRRSIVMVMGGTFQNYIHRRPFLRKALSLYAAIYVETAGMKAALEEFGLFNVRYFPNCRERPTGTAPTYAGSGNKLRCVFFSAICEDKGADTVLAAAKMLGAEGACVEIHFYGPVQRDFSARFYAEADQLESVKYHGVFDASDTQRLYGELSKYDVLLFPTRWRNEGVPGILIEAKISGLPAIVSDINYNSEIVTDGVDGLVLEQCSPEVMRSVLANLLENSSQLEAMKVNSKDSGRSYYIDSYIDSIVDAFENISSQGSRKSN